MRTPLDRRPLCPRLARTQAPCSNSRANEEPPSRSEMPARSVGCVKLSTGTSTPRRISAVRRGIGGGIWPIGIEETLPVESEAGHLFAERAPRNVELLHHGADLSAALRQ